MIWTAYLDESGTHDSPLISMGGHLGNADQWKSFDAAWKALLETEGITSCHAKDLRHSAKQFKGWSRERREIFEAKANKIIADNLQFGLIVVMRDDDYRQVYKRPANPYKLRQDSKYGLLFRGCLQQIEYAVTQNVFPPAPDLKLNFILEQCHDNTGDVLRLFELAKKEHLPGCEHILGTVTLGDKTIYGLQAADLLVHRKNRLEMKDYSRRLGDISKSSYLRQRGSPPVQGYAEYRFAITRKALQGLRDDFHYPDDQRTSMQSR